MMSPFRCSCFGWPLLSVLTTTLICLVSNADDATETPPEAGHSAHGEAFDDGPRQAARLLSGLAKITFPTAAKNSQAQAFVEQGVAQLHGFWYFEAERSFRQAAAIEPELAIAYWGCAMANIENSKRAIGFIGEAKKRCGAPTTGREKLYIEALDRYSTARDKAQESTDDKKKEAQQQAHQRYIADLEKIIDDFPNDNEAKAFLVLQLWLADQDGLKMPSRYAVSALLDGIFASQPLHPAHHYRIHLWDKQRPKNALDSAAKSGPAMPGVAHMWHMPGHTYSKLFRYDDAAWQQEAAARVDHAFMIDTRLIPDQIHNFAHNHEWMIRNWLNLGRVQDAIRHSKYLISLPQHPKYNTHKKGSFHFGRERLLQTLTSFSLWPQLIEEASGPFLSTIDNEAANQERNAWLAVAYVMEANRAEGQSRLRALRRKKIECETRLLDAEEQLATGDTDKTLTDSIKESKQQIKHFQSQLARVQAAAATMRGDKESLARTAKTAKLDSVMLAQWQVIAKDLEGAQKTAELAVKAKRGEVLPLAVLIDILWRQDKHDEALKRFSELRKIAHVADLDTPVLTRLAAVAGAAKVSGDWRIAKKMSSDVGERPDWKALGPEFWHAGAAPTFDVEATDGSIFTSNDLGSKPRLVFFYLGFGCLHCIEQLKAFSPLVEQFRALGIEAIAISNEDLKTLKLGIENFPDPIPIPLYADSQQAAFKAFRCWDDFEAAPLHGTYLLDAQGQIRWQDIGPEPFNDAKFLLTEAERLLALPD